MADGTMDIAPDAEVKDFSYNSKMYSASKLSAIMGGFLPLGGGQMSGDVNLGKDNKIVFGLNSAEQANIAIFNASEADFGIVLSAEENGSAAYYSKYLFPDIESSSFTPLDSLHEDDPCVMRAGDVYAVLSGYYKKSETSSAAEISSTLD